MNILVTGGAGFIGSHVVDRMIDAGHSVTVVDDLSTGNRDNLNSGARFIEGNIAGDEMDAVFAEGNFDAVCHLAAQINVTASVSDPIHDAAINVLGTINLIQCALKHNVGRFIFSSTGGAIYGSPENLPASEATPAEPASPYGTSKLACEEYIKMFGRSHGLKFVILRYTNVFGPRQIPHGECGVCAVLTDLMLAGKQPTLYGHGEPVRDYVYVGDVARANVAALDKGEGATVNIGTGRATTVMDIFNALKGPIGFNQEPVLKDLRAGEVEKIFCTNDRAKEILGWSPEVDLAEGLKATVEFFQAKA